MQLRRFFLTAVLSLALVVSLFSLGGRAEVGSLQSARDLYNQGDYSSAAKLLQQIIQQSSDLEKAAALSNLALVYSQQGNWSEANSAIDQSLALLKNNPNSTALLAQTLHLQGRLQYVQGRSQKALNLWQTSAQAYRQINDSNGEQRSLLRQAQALQTLGFYQRSLTILESLESQLDAQPDSVTKAEGFRQLGEMLAIVGRSSSRKSDGLTAQTALEKASAVADRVQNPATIASTKLALGNYYHGQAITQLRRDIDRTDPTIQAQIKTYQQKAAQLYNAVTTTDSSLRAQLNQMRLNLELSQPESAAQSWQAIETAIAPLSPTQSTLDLRVNLLDNLITLKQQQPALGPDIKELQQQIQSAKKLATDLNQTRSQAYLAILSSNLSAWQNDGKSALQSTDEGIFWAKTASAPDILYRLYNQRGSLLDKKGDRPGAITAYKSAVATLKSIRADVDSVSSDSLFSFQNDISPIHRNLVRLLLQDRNGQPDEATLREARNVIESLQVAELNNYLGSDCLQAKQVNVENLKAAEDTAVIYPIVLPDRLAVIVSLPGKARSLKLFSSPIAEAELNRTLQDLRSALADKIDLATFQEPSRKVYNWLIRPIEPSLGQAQTLMFVLDGKLRNVPMGALSDGKQFLIEKYNLALAPSLQLVDPKPLENQQLGVLAFGLSDKEGEVLLPSGQSRKFSMLPNVKQEIDSIQLLIQNTKSFIDGNFTDLQFRTSVKNSTVPIVHLATHGEFSSDRDSTFLLATDGAGKLTTIGLDELSMSLAREGLDNPLELLILSACQTAAGDDRAALGIAGVALRSGARSTIASLWGVDDQATSILMQKLYEQVKTQKVTRSQALRTAQITLLQDPQYGHPYYWAPFILVGNWL
jgi:CHAT domain-containing protein/predicted negative regulator of RcsB-dependent stress response